MGEGITKTKHEQRLHGCKKKSVHCVLLWGSGVQWLARWTHDPAVADSIPTTAHVVIALEKQFTYIPSVHPSAKWEPGHRQLKCIDYIYY